MKTKLDKEFEKLKNQKDARKFEKLQDIDKNDPRRLTLQKNSSRFKFYEQSDKSDQEDTENINQMNQVPPKIPEKPIEKKPTQVEESKTNAPVILREKSQTNESEMLMKKASSNIDPFIEKDPKRPTEHPDKKLK